MMFDNEKVVIHAYNTTQNVSVQGRKREPFVQNILEPFLLTMIHSATDRIEKLNDEVKEMLGEKKTAKNKTINSLKCPYCAKKSASKVNLRAHLKESHTKPELKSPMNKKMIKLVEEKRTKQIVSRRPLCKKKSINQKCSNARNVISIQRQRMRLTNTQKFIKRQTFCQKNKNHVTPKILNVRNVSYVLKRTLN